MALHTIDQYAAICNLPRKNLMTYIGRRKVVVVDDLIDDLDPKNVLFYEKRRSKGLLENGEPEDEPAAKREITPKRREKSYDDDSTSLTNLEKKEQELDIRIKEEKARYEKIKADKAEGLVIPTELVKGLMLQHSKSIATETKNFIEDFITRMGVKYKISASDLSNERKKGIDGLNLSIKNSKDRTVAQLNNIIEEYSIAKGRGERD